MIKVNTIKKRADEIYANRPKNQGGLLGGAEFAAKSLAAGVGSIGEGVVDIFGAAGNLIVGDVEGAKDMFRNNVVGDWYAAEREEYNPDGVMSFVGDTLHGIGQSAALFIPYAGAPLYYAGIVSQGVSSAAAKTGDVGFKELAYGGTMGALEGIIDKALGGAASKVSNAVKGIGKNAGKSTGKALFKATTDASRKGLMRKILSSAASEFAEEFASEYADTFLQRVSGIDPTKQYSLKDAIYSGFVGMASGMVTTSAVEIPRSINYAKKGRSIIDRGNSQTLVNTATVVADKLANKGTNFKNAAGWVTALRGQVDAYNDLVKKGKGDSASAATILGEMQAYLSYAETKAVHAGLMEKIEKASDEDKAALAEYINMLVDKENRKKDYTAEDITNNTDEIASQLAIMQFAGMALDYESITKDDMREQEISEAIANERNTSTEETPAATVEDAPFAEAMSKAEETPAQVAENVETGQTVDTESAPTPAKTAADIKRGVKNATNKIEVQGKLYEISEANIDDISNRAENLIKSGVSETDAVAQAIDEGLSDIRSLDEGGKLSPVFAKARIAKIKGAIINAYRQGIQNEAKKAAKEAKLAEDTETHKTEETATEEKIVPEAETKTEAPNTSNYTKIKGAIVPNKSAQATKTKEAPKQQNAKVEEKSSDRTNESSENKTEPPKVSEAKESLTDEQRAERARKRAKEMLEWELNNTPTVNELNTAREYVKGFDNLSPERRQSIIRMMRTAKGIDVKIVKGIANLMAIKAGTDLDLRFDEEVSEYGVSVKSEGRTLIIISSKTDFKETVEGTVVHELVHYLENKSGYRDFAKHVLKRVKPEKKKEVEDQVTKQYNERYEQIYRKEYTKQGLKGAELNKAVKDALESAQHKAMIDSEVVAELVGQALNSDKFLSRYARIGNTDGFIKKAYTFLRAMVKELKSKDKENNELADIIMPTIKSMDRLLKMENSKEGVSGKKYSFSSIAYTFFGEEDMTVGEFTERNYKETEGYKAYVEECLDNFRQSRGDSFNEAAARKEIEDGIAGIVRVAVAAKKAGYDIYDSAGQRNARDSKQRLLFSSLEPNSDYFTSSDISTICDKRKNFTEIEDEINRIEAEKGVPREKRFFADINNFFTLHDILARHGLTTACRQCYVESMRKNLGRMANAFIDLVTETDENNKSNKQLYSKGELKSGNAELRRRVRELIEQEDIPSEYLRFETLTNGEKLADMRLQYPLLFEAYNSFYGQSKPKMPKRATPFRFGELTALLTDHNGKINQTLLKRINSTGGFRLQSYSDFQIKNYVDVLQVIFEAGTLGLNGHAYTKVPAFLEATEGTNLKRNISIFMYRDGNEWKIDRNDSFPWRLEKIYEVVNADKSGDTGIIAVSQNDDMSAWIMANDNVGYGIPFHKSGTKMGVVRETVVKTPEGDVKGYLGIKDHTRSQSEVYAKGENKGKKVKAPINIYEFWDFNNTRMSRKGLIEKNVKKYIDECERLGYLPKFREYVMNNEKVLQATLEYAKKLGYADSDATVDDISFKYKGYTIPYGYYKFLVDFGVFTPDGKASPVKALSLKNYDFDKAVRFFSDSKKLRVNELLQQIANGEERDKYRKLINEGKMTITELGKVIKDKRDAVVAEVVGEKKYSLTPKESQTNAKEEGKKVDDAAYMAAVESGDMETAQRMVDEAAKDWGAVTNGNARVPRPLHLYHGTGTFGFTRFRDGAIYATVSQGVAAGYNRGKGLGKIRSSSLGYIPNDGTVETAITNAKNVLGATLTKLDDVAKQNIISKADNILKDVANRVAEIDEATDYGKAAEFFEYLTEKYGEDKTVQWTNQLDNLHYMLVSEYTAEEIVEDGKWLAHDIERYHEWKQSLSELWSEEREAIKDATLDKVFRYLLGYEYGDALIDIEYGLGRLIDDRKKLVNPNGNLVYLDDIIDAIEMAKDTGIYDLYGHPGEKPLIIDEGKRFWDAIPFENRFRSTDYIVKWAKDNRYTSVLFKTVLDPSSGGSENVYADEWVFFNSNQVKSADPVTYDDNGDVIPLSERFNAKKRDIRYSLAPKTKNINEKIAREAAENAKVENAQVFAKKDVEIAVRSIEGWTQEEILSLATGQENLELQHMNKAKREEMISQIYIALHEEGAKGRVGPGHVAVKALAANIASDYIDSAKIVGENNKSVHLKEIYDESSINQFKQDLTDLLYGEFAHMGHATRNADFQAIIRKQKEEFGQEQLSATRAGKESRNLAYQGKKLRELVEKQKRDSTAEDIVKVTKAMADVIDAKGNIRVNAVDKAMSEASRFFEGEKAKMESEKNALKTADGKATYTLSDFAWMANDDIKFMIDEYLRLREGREGKALTAEEMRLASEVLHAMKVTIERYNKEYVNGHWIDAEEAAKDSIADLTAAWREKEYKNKVTEWLGNKVVKGVQEKYFYKILTPETIVETLEGFAKNGLLKSLYHSIRIHKQKAEHLAVQLKKPLAKFMDNKENDWTDDNGHKRRFRSKLNKKMISVNGANGVVDLTLGEAIYLFMLTKREAAHAGLLENGYIVYNDKNQQRAKLRLTDIENTRNNIYNAFDKTDLEFLEMAENFFNKTSSKIKYDADMNIFGYTNIQDGYYVPMIRDRYSRMHGVTDARQSIGSIITVYNKSFNQNLVENAKALEGKNIMSIISDHADGLADYSELYLPLKAFDRIYNRAIVTDDGITSIRRVLNNDVWNGTERYFKDLFADIQGQRDQRDNVVDNLVGSIRSAWVNSVLGANVKVVVTQTTSLAAATQVINAKYIAQTAYLASPGKLPGLQELRERAYKYSDIIEARNFDMGAIKAQGNIDKVTWLGEKSGWAIGWMDERICLAIFHAAELQIQAQYGHAVGTEENAKLAAKLADEAIYTTQAMSSASERSALQRSTSEIAKMFSMFTSDTVKNLSHLYGNIMKWNAFRLRAKAGDSTYAAEMKECGRDIRKSMRTLAITGVMLGLITQAFKYLFGKAEEDPEEQKKDLVADVAGSTLNVLPIVSEFVDKIFFDYDMSINVLDVANDTLEAVRGGMKIAGKSIKGEYVSTNDAIKTSTGIIMSGLSFTGLPVSPAERLVTGLLRFASPEAAYGYNSIFNSPSYTSDLKKAVESGDADLAEYILERLYKDEMAGTYTVPELEEIVRLYTLTDEEGNHYNVLPKRTLKKMDDDTELNAAQRKQFNSIYSQASAKVNELIRSEEYKMLDDKAKAKAIRDTYELYYNRAAAEVVGKEWSANQAYSKLTDNYTVLMASKAYKSSLEAYKTDSGKEVTVKEQFSQYVKNLNLSDNDYLIVAYANGYKGKKTTRALLKYMNSLDLNEAEKQQIAKALNFDLKNGQFTEKED